MQITPVVVDTLGAGLRINLVHDLSLSLTHALVPALTTALDAVASVSTHGVPGAASGAPGTAPGAASPAETAAAVLAADRTRAMALWGSMEPSERAAVQRACAACGGFPWPPTPVLLVSVDDVVAGHAPAAQPALPADSPQCITCHRADVPFAAYLRHYFSEYFAHYYGCYAANYATAAVNATETVRRDLRAAAAAAAVAGERAADAAAVRAAGHTRAAQVGGSSP